MEDELALVEFLSNGAVFVVDVEPICDDDDSWMDCSCCCCTGECNDWGSSDEYDPYQRDMEETLMFEAINDNIARLRDADGWSLAIEGATEWRRERAAEIPSFVLAGAAAGVGLVPAYGRSLYATYDAAAQETLLTRRNAIFSTTTR
jgi:hypothetical protein